MKRFIILISCLMAGALILVLCFYVGGFYIKLSPESTPTVSVRIQGKQIELLTENGWQTIELRGVNLGSGLPGEWSTDYAIDRETYLRWFAQIQAMGANVIRVYSVQNSAFYEALASFNLEQETPLYLLQGIWVNDYAQNSHMDAYDNEFRQRLIDDCITTVDVLHGKRFILSNNANTSTGFYLHNVSQWVLGYIIGAEWNDVTVAYTDEKYLDLDRYEGVYLRTTENATAFESLLAEVGDRLIAYETTRYGEQRLVAFANGKTTDPFDYPESVTDFFRKCASIDAEHILATDAFRTGIFASYSAYSYDLDYLSVMDPSTWTDLLGRTADLSDCDGTNGTFNTYYAYLKLLNLHHTMPVVAIEFGTASGRGLAQRNDGSGEQEGHLSESEQGHALVRCYQDIIASGCAGACVFSWQDEWHKRTWNTMYAVDLSRNTYWNDVQSNDQHFGLLAFEPGAEQNVCIVDGDVSEWEESDCVITYTGGSSVSVKYDAAYLYLLVSKPGYSFGAETLYLPIDTTQKTGSTTCTDYALQFDKAADFLLVIHDEQDSRLLVQDRYHSIHANYEAELTGNDAYIDPPAKDSTHFETIQMAVKDIARQYREGNTTLETFETGLLRYGDANPEHTAYDSLADFMANGENLEIRLPWELLNVSDPSRMQIHDDYYDGNYGVQFITLNALSIGLGTGENEIKTGTISLKGWGNRVEYHERLKPAYYDLQTCWTGGDGR